MKNLQEQRKVNYNEKIKDNLNNLLIQQKSDSGITLITLVITIILMVILARS